MRFIFIHLEFVKIGTSFYLFSITPQKDKIGLENIVIQHPANVFFIGNYPSYFIAAAYIFIEHV
jgi:hypothetical protein